jgi:multiple sugar transport system substrate-binding protein
MNRLVQILLLFCLLILGCSNSRKTKGDIIEIEFWQAMGGPLGDALAELVAEFNRTHPDIKINSINMGNYTALSQKLMASIQTGNQPHIAQAYEAWIANFLKGGVIIPIQHFIESDSTFNRADLEDFYPVFINSCTIDDVLVSFPFNKSVRVQYYNKDILFKNDLDPNRPPQTWDDFRYYARKLTQDLDGDGKIDQFGTTIRISAWQFENLLLQAGGEIMNESNTKPLFNGREGVMAMEYMNNLLNVDKSAYLSPGYEGQKDFTAQKIAFYEDSSVSMAYMLRTGIDFNIGVSAIPHRDTKRSIISGTNIVIFDKGDEKVQKAAWQFIKWFTEAPQTARWSELTYYMPVRRSAFLETAIRNRLDSNPEMASVYEQLEFAAFEPQISEWFETRKYLEDQVIEKVLRGTLSPQKALDNAARLIESKLKN